MYVCIYVCMYVCAVLLNRSLTLSLPQDVYDWGQFFPKNCLEERPSEPETFVLRKLHVNMLEKSDFKQDVDGRFVFPQLFSSVTYCPFFAVRSLQRVTPGLVTWTAIARATR